MSKISLLKIINNRQEFRFIVVGVWNTLFGYIIFILLDSFFSYILPARYLAYLSAMALGQVIAIINAFIFHKFYTFKSGIKGKALLKEFIRFSSTYIFTFLLNMLLLPLCVEVFKLHPKIAGAVIIPITTIISYIAHSKFSFRIQ